MVTSINNGVIEHYYYVPKLHRVDGPAVTYPRGTQKWMQHGFLHRVGMPAYVSHDGDKAYYINGKLHREYGPAIELADGTTLWFLNGVQLNDIEIEELKKKHKL